MIPHNVSDAIFTHDWDIAEQWFRLVGPDRVNDRHHDGTPALVSLCCTSIDEGCVRLARFLIDQGADVHLCTNEPNYGGGVENGLTPLHYAARGNSGPDDGEDNPHQLELISVLLAAGANVNATCPVWDSTPLSMALLHLSRYFRPKVVSALLRAGASLDSFHGGHPATGEPAQSVEEYLRSIEEEYRGEGHLYPWQELTDNASYAACKAIIAGVRAEGSWKAYARRCAGITKGASLTACP